MSPAHKTRCRDLAKPRFCYCCCAPAPRWAKYCPRCRHFLTHKDKRARALALKAAWDPVAKGFRCYYTGIILDENDLSSPWYLTFDHRTPRKKGDLVVCAAWINYMKNQLCEEEYKAVIIEFARSRQAGEPFNIAVAEFKYWTGFATKKPTRSGNLTSPYLPEFGDCAVCSARTYPYSLYCPRCRAIIKNACSDIKEHVIALQAAWDPARKAFVCSLTGLALNPADNSNPLFLTFDHRIPRQKGTLRVAAAFANIMKTALSDDEFWLVVKELAHHFQTGEAFNKDIIKFAYWKGWGKAKMRAMKARKAKARVRRA